MERHKALPVLALRLAVFDLGKGNAALFAEQNRCGVLRAVGTFVSAAAYPTNSPLEEDTMDGLIYLVGLIVIIMFILSFFGLR